MDATSLFINFGTKTYTVNIPKNFEEVTVGELRRNIATQVRLPNRSLGPEDFTLSYGGKPLSTSKDSSDKLIDFDIDDHSEIVALIRVSGGTYHVSQGRKIDQSVAMTNEECIISLDDENPTMMMPCGHPVAPDSLAEYIETEVRSCKTELKCPACKKVWKLSKIKKMGLTEEERQSMEFGLSKNYIISHPAKYKQCPQCQAFIEKKDEGIRIQCPMCSNFEFCWNCLRKWRAPGTGYRVCGNSGCDQNAGLLETLLNCKTTIMQYSGLEVPDTRACIKCGQGINHKAGCKHMTCPTCKEEFCFVCLKKWPCVDGSAVYAKKCEVAPRQKKLPKI